MKNNFGLSMHNSTSLWK